MPVEKKPKLAKKVDLREPGPARTAAAREASTKARAASSALEKDPSPTMEKHRAAAALHSDAASLTQGGETHHLSAEHTSQALTHYRAANKLEAEKKASPPLQKWAEKTAAAGDDVPRDDHGRFAPK